jgi:tetratricopeptide (TPR) repeat protein
MVRAGHGQVVGISGDPGIGKSRLVREFRQKLRGEAVTYLEGHCLSYGANIPYLPILEMLRYACRIADNDPPPRVAQKLRLTLGRLAMDANETLPYLMRLLGVKEDPEGLDDSSPETIRKHTILALRQMCVSAARQQPLVILVEDLHWIDPASEALGSIAEGLTGIPLLLILTYRPEYRPAWLDKSYVTQIGLQPLSPEESLTLLTGSLFQHRLLDTVAREIVSKADGNPFFLEELGRTVREQDDLHISGSVPGTVQEVLLSRINRLTVAQKRLLQCAAVVGKDIPAALLAAIAGPDVDVPETIRQLRLAEFIYERSPEPDAEYTFKHALTYDVAYGSLRSRERRDLHARIVDALEQTYAERLSEHVERLADHSYRGELWAKAVRYLREAGAKALSKSANREAALFFEQALAALAHLGDGPETMEQAIDLRFEIRNALTPLGAAPRILEQLGQAQALAERLNDGRRLGRALSFSANCLYLMGDYPRAIEAGQRAQQIAESLDDPSLKIATEMYLARAYQSLGAYRTAADILRRTVTTLSGPAIHDRLGLPVLPSVFSRSHLVACLTEMGDFGEAGPWADEAIEVAEVIRQPDNLFWAYRALALIHLGRGAGQEAAAVLEPALAACQASELLLYVAAFSSDLGLAYALSGRVIEGLELLEHAVAETAVRSQSYYPQALLHLGEGYLEAGRWSDAEDCGQRALDLARTRGERGREAHALRLLADIAARGSSPAHERAQDRYGPALTLADELGMRPSSARCHLGLGLLLSRQGHRAEAHASLTRAVRTLEATQMLSWLRQARLALEALG